MPILVFCISRALLVLTRAIFWMCLTLAWKASSAPKVYGHFIILPINNSEKRQKQENSEFQKQTSIFCYQQAKRKFKEYNEMKRNASHKMIYDADEESGFDEIPEEVFEGETR